MPISDEIIELAPVKKTKSKLIIMFVVMGVLLAAAVAFLVMYLIKPSAVASDGSVDAVKITESTTLFSTTDEDDEPILTASVGNSYTVCASIYVRGNSSPAIAWIVESDGRVVNSAAVFKGISDKLIDEKNASNSDGEIEKGKTRYTYSYTFTPIPASVGKEITLTAVSQGKTSQSDKIKFTVVEQATEYIFFNNYRRGSNGTRMPVASNNTLSVPFYSLPANNEEFIVSFSQKGKAGVNKDEYSEITVDSANRSDEVSVIIDGKDAKDIVEVTSYSYQSSTFAFKIKAAGEADILVTANINNSATEVKQKLHIVAKSTSELGIIDNIYFTDKPVDADFYKHNWMNAANNRPLEDTDNVKISQTLTLPYDSMGNYNDILKHIVLVPFSLQCNRAENGDCTLKDGWQDKIKVESSNSNICEVTHPYNSQLKYYNWTLGCRGLSGGVQCIITISDSTSGAVAKPCSVALNVIAPTKDLGLSFKLGDTVYTVGPDGKIKDPTKEETLNAIAISQLAEGELTVSYKFQAPAGTDVTTMVDKGYISRGFVVSFDELLSDDSAFMTVELKDLVITPDKENKFEGKNFTIELERNQTTSYIGTATFTLTVGDNDKVKNGVYTLNYKKIGIPLSTATVSDPDVTRSIRFKVTEVATTAHFVTEAEGNKVITANGTRAGSFKVLSDEADNHVCNIYVQNQSNGTPITTVIDFSKLIEPDQGKIKLSGTISSNELVAFSGYASRPYGELTFKGEDPSGNSATSRQALIRIETVADATSNKSTGTFVFNIYVVNAISSITCKGVNDQVATSVDYTKDNYSQSLSFNMDTISATRTYPQNTTDLNGSDVTFKLMYFYGNDYLYFDEKPVKDAPDNISYGITVDDEFNEVFRYNASRKRIVAVADPFLVGFNCGQITLGKIQIEYATVNSEYYVQPELTCIRKYTIVRQADDIGLYADRTYQKQVDKDEQGNYAYSLNQNEHGTLYASAIIKNGKNDIIVKRYQEGQISDCDIAYMVVQPDIGLQAFSGTGYSKEVSNSYTNISFDAPPVSGNAPSQLYSGKITLYRTYDSSSGTSVNITVLNAARPIAEFGLYKDQAGVDKLETLEFGKFAQDSDFPYTLTFYIRIKYGAAQENVYVYFESAELALPQYLRLSIDDDDYKAVESKYQIGQDIITRTGDDGSILSNIDDDDVLFVAKCTVQLIADKSQYRDGKNDADKIELKCSSKSDKSEARAKVGTGISSVSYTVTTDDGVNKIISSDNKNTPLKIVLKSGTDVQTIKIPFEINTFVDNTEYGFDSDKKTGILYNVADLTVTGSELDGILFDSGTDANDLYISFTIDKSKIQNIDGETFTVTFTDKASGTPRNITVLFTITVESDIYDIDLGTYSFTTTGKSDVTTETVSLTYNYGLSALQPSEELISKITADVYTLSGGEYTKYEVGDISVAGSDGEFTLSVKNTVLTSVVTVDGKKQQYYYLGVSYGNKTFYTPITIDTVSEDISLETEASGNLAVAGAVVNGRAGETSIYVKTSAQTFNLAAYIYNRGIGSSEKINKTVDYKLYTNAARTDEMTGENRVAEIDENGTIRFVKPPQVGYGILYYRASFHDDGLDIDRYIDVNVDYTVTIASVSLEGILGDIQNDKTITLYYIDSGAYTQIDLTNFIKVGTDASLDGVDIPAGTTTTITSKNSSILAVNGKILSPIGYTADPIAFDITATDGETSVTETYYVLIKAIAVPTLTPSATVLNVVADDSIDVVADIIDYDGLKYEYSVSGYNADLFAVVKNDETLNIKAKRDYAFNGTEYASDKTYAFIVNVRYTNDATSAVVVGGERFAVNKSVSLKLAWTYYTPKFKVISVNGGEETVVGSSDDTTVKVMYDDAAQYYIQLDTDSVDDAAWYAQSDWTYTATDGNNIVELGSFDTNGRAEIIVYDAFGTTELTVRAAAYGNSVSVVKNVTFNYGDNTKTSISYTSDGTSYMPITLTDNAATVAIDFGTPLHGDVLPAKVFRYEIDATSVGSTVSASDIKVMYSGDVTTDGVIRSGATNKFYMLFTAEDVTKFTVNCTIYVGGRTYYKDPYTLNLVASKPDLTATVNISEILPDSTAQFGVDVDTNGFVGDYTVSYEILDGKTVADISAASGLLTPKKNNTEDYRVVVGIKVTVTDGVFAGSEYKLEKALTILGVPMPDLVIASAATKTWNNSATTVAAGAAVNFAGEFALSDVVAGGETYSFSNATYAYAFTAPSGASSAGFTTTDYEVNNSTLTVKLTNKTRAGGRFGLTVTATLGVGVNSGKTVSKTFYIDVVPTAKAVSGVTVSGRKGSYDVKDAVGLYSGNATGQITATDEYTVSYALANGTTTVLIGDRSRALSEIVSVFGSVITLKENIPTAVSIMLTPTVTMRNGAYVGTSFTGVNTSITVNGFVADEKTVAWDSSEAVNAYSVVNVAQLLPSVLTSYGTPIIEVRALSYAAYAVINDNGTSAPTISIDKTINVKASGSSTTAKINLELIVSFNNGVEYFGTCSLSVSSITPNVTVTLNPTPRTENGKDYVDLTAGASLGVSLTESHGLDISGVATSALANTLTAVVSGSNLVITAADVTVSSTQDITIYYTVGGMSYTYDFTVGISPRGDSSSFTVTNENVTVAKHSWFNYSDLNNGKQSKSTYAFVSEWIASDNNKYTKPYYMYLATQNYYYNPVGEVISHVRVEGYDANGNLIGTVNCSITPTTRYTYLYFTRSYSNSEGTIIGDARRIVVTFGLNKDSDKDREFTVRYYTTQMTNSSSTSTSKTYSVTLNNNINIKLDKNASDAVLSSSEWTLASGTNYNSVPEPTRTGYDFKGWYLDKSCKTAAPATIVKYSHTLYAGWTEATYKVKFDNNYEGGTSTTVMQTFGSTYNLPSNPRRTGYAFAGWYTATTGGNNITEVTVVPANPDLTLYARWTPNKYTVTFSDDALDDFSKTKTVTYGDEYGNLPVPVKTGYTFGGWYNTPTVSAQTDANKITSTTKVATTNNHTLYAKWTEKDYVVTLDPDGGTLDGTTTRTVKYNAAYPTLPVPTRTGYTFNGWYTQHNGAGTAITNASGTNATGVKLTTASAHTLYAYWTENTYRVTFSGATTNPTYLDVTYGQTYAGLNAVVVTAKTGHTFVEWHDAAGNVVTSDTKVAITADATLTAVFKANTYKVTLNGGAGATVTPAEITVTYGEKYTALNGVTATKPGYVFKGWKYNGADIVSSDDVEITVNNATFTAVWDNAKYTVTLLNATADKNTIEVTYGGTFAALDTVTVADREGYTFGGWYDINGNVVTKDTEVTITADAVLIAEWTGNTYEVTIDYNRELENDTSTVTVKHGDVAYTLYNTPVRDEYTFEYWYTLENGVETTFDVETQIKKNITVYAKWKLIPEEENTYTVTLDYNRGLENDTLTVTVKHGDVAYILYKTPVRDGYTFDGWYIDNSGTEEAFDVETAIKSDVTVYAKWTAIPVEPEPTPEYTVTLDYDRGDGETTTVTVKEGEIAYILYKTPTWDEDHKFEYWYTLDGENETEFDPDTPITEDVTVYAKWDTNSKFPPPEENGENEGL